MYTYDQTLSALHDVVDADPFRKNGACIYFEGGKFTPDEHVYTDLTPVCVVGQVISRLDLTDLRAYLIESGAGRVPASWDHPFYDYDDDEYRRTRLEFEEHFTPPAVDLLATVQSYADEYEQWGDALRMGDSEVRGRLASDELV